MLFVLILLLLSTVKARNELERYTYSVRNSLDREDLKDKFSDEERTKIQEALDSTLSWLDEHRDEADASAYESKQKELEGVVNPIMVRIYGASASDPADAEGPPRDSKFSEA